MIFQKPFNARYRITCRIREQSGIILVDILVALALGSVFVASITLASGSVRESFETARERDYALDIYEAYQDTFQGMMPGEERHIEVAPRDEVHGTTTLSALGRWYGNDRIQTDISIWPDTSNPHVRPDPIIFNMVSTYPYGLNEMPVATPLCSVDMAHQDVVGSYTFQHHVDDGSVTLSVRPILLPIDPLLPLTDIEVRNGIAYISSDSAAAGDPDMFVVDIANIDNPSVVASLNTGPGIASIVLARDRIYAAATSMAAQVHVIRNAGQGGLSLERKIQVPLPYATATPPVASSITYDAGDIYLGTEKWIGEEFLILNESGDRLAGMEIGSKVGDISVRLGRAHIATAGLAQLIDIDISDPLNPMVTDSFEPTGNQRQEGRVVSTFEDENVFGRTSGGFNIKADHEVFIWSATSTPHESNMSADIAGGVYGFVIDRSHIYAISHAVGKEILIFDRSASSVPQVVSLPAMPQSITCEGGRLYVLAQDAPVIYQITFE